MNLCEDCKQCQTCEDAAYANCFSPRNRKLGLRFVGGKVTENSLREKYCDSQRFLPWPLDFLFRECGRRGRWFEAKAQE